MTDYTPSDFTDFSLDKSNYIVQVVEIDPLNEHVNGTVLVNALSGKWPWPLPRVGEIIMIEKSSELDYPTFEPLIDYTVKSVRHLIEVSDLDNSGFENSPTFMSVTIEVVPINKSM